MFIYIQKTTTIIVRKRIFIGFEWLQSIFMFMTMSLQIIGLRSCHNMMPDGYIVYKVITMVIC